VRVARVSRLVTQVTRSWGEKIFCEKDAFGVASKDTYHSERSEMVQVADQAPSKSENDTCRTRVHCEYRGSFLIRKRPPL